MRVDKSSIWKYNVNNKKARWFLILEAETMKYKTIIELTCEAADKEEASNTAGEYLRSMIDIGVDMRCRTVSADAHRLVKYGLTTIVALLFISSLLVNFIPFGGAEKAEKTGGVYFPDTCTVMPALKTGDRDEFQKEWEKKEEEVILDYLKD